MPIDYAQEADDLGALFKTIAANIGSYLHDNPGLADDQYDQLLAYQGKALNCSNKFIELSDKITFANDQQYFQKVDEATAAIKANLETIATTDKWITFAGAVVSLGTSILSANGGGIISSVSTILSTFNINPAEDGQS